MNPITIAVAGKGGVGKTTTCGILIEHLAATGRGPVLAVDADANSNLNEVLGVDVELTLGDIRENIAKSELAEVSPIPAGMTKQEYAEFMFSDALIEGDDYDMLVMGRTQGAGCYCYVNGLLTTQIQKYSSGYRYIVVDNEAGLEHISRGTLPRMDIILLISDCSRRGIQAAGRLAGMVKDMELNPDQMKLIVNRAPDGKLSEGVMEEIELQGLDLLGVLPADENVYNYDCDGKPSAHVPDDSPIKLALNDIFEKLGL